MPDRFEKSRFETQAVHAGVEPDPATGSIMTPVYLTSTYVQDAPDKHKGFDYARTVHPTRLALEKSLAALEGGGFGVGFASGCAAATAVLQMLSAGDHVVSCSDLYGGTYRLFNKIFARFNVGFTYVDTRDLEAVENAFKPETKLLWIETPSNPLLRVSDIKALCALARKRGILAAVDNTFATPYLQRPLEMGADIVVHSTTKYLGGHSDVIGGAAVTASEELAEKLKFIQNSAGAVPGPLDCFLVLRGVKTLPLRMEKHCSNALAVAKALAGRPEVARVHYPGLPSDPNHELASRQMRLPGGMVSFELKSGKEGALKALKRLKVFSLAESLGGVESLISHPATMTHAAIPPEERRKTGVTDGLFRLSVGIEAAEDLVEDLVRAIS